MAQQPSPPGTRLRPQIQPYVRPSVAAPTMFDTVDETDDLQDEQRAAPEPQTAANRPNMREPMREESSAARAARRALELEGVGVGDESTEQDKYHIDASVIPDGWAYQWKMQSVLGKEDPGYQTNIERGGWEAVPASRHPEMMPLGGNYKTIDRDGMRLYERPQSIDDKVRARNDKAARDQVRQKEVQLGAAPDGQFGRDNKGSPLVKVGKSYEAVPIPD